MELAAVHADYIKKKGFPAKKWYIIFRNGI